MRSSPALAALTLALALGAPGNTSATARFASTTGDDYAAGTIEAPWRSLAVAVTRLAPGDTLYIRGGRYYQWSLTVSANGTAAAPIVIRSYPGEVVTLDPTFPAFRAPGNQEWQPVNPAIGQYISRNSVLEGVVLSWVVGLPGYENERLRLTPFHHYASFNSPNDAYDPTSFYAGPGTYEGGNRLHIRLAKTTDLREAEQRYGRVFAEEIPHPADYDVVVTGAGSALNLYGSYLVLKDLILEPGYSTVVIGNGAHDLVLDGLTIWSGRYGIETRGSGVHHVKVTGCRIYGDCPPWVFRSDVDSDVPPYPASSLRTTSILLGYDTHDWEISYNHIRGSAQYLIESQASTWYSTTSTYNLSIHHNRLENAAEEAMRFEHGVSLGRIEVYENFISNCLRVIAAGQYTPAFDGPLLLYRNVVALLRDPPVNRSPGLLTWNRGYRYGYEYMFRLAGSTFTTRNTHLYHNTLVLLNSAGKGINLLPQFPADGRFANNLMMLVNGRVHGAYPAGSGRIVDGNLYWKLNTLDTERLMDSYDTAAGLHGATGLEEHGLGAVAKRGTDPQLPLLDLDVVDPTQTRWAITPGSERTQPWHFALAASSPARGAGIVIPPHPALGVLPDTRSSLDIGALPYGTTAADFAFFPFDPAVNQAPIVDAGPDRTNAPPTVALHGTVSDDGHPTTGALASRWSLVSGPGSVRFSSPGALETEATFSAGGPYVLMLTSSDGEKTVSDELRVTSGQSFMSVDVAVATGLDDAEEGGPNSVTTSGTQLHLGLSGSTPKTVGVRFDGVEVPRGASVIGAYVQFSSYGGGSNPAQLTVKGESADQALPFAATAGNLTARPKTAASVSWSAPGWAGLYETLPVERTPDLSAVIEEIIDRTGWTSGNALALFIDGTGNRSAFSCEGNSALSPRLHIEYVPLAALDVPTEAVAARLRATVTPHPVRGEGTLRFSLPRAGPVLAELFDVRGRRVRVLVDAPRMEAGQHEARIGATVTPGVYFYRMRAAGEVVTGRCLLLR